MKREYGGTREDFAAVGAFRGDAAGLYDAARAADFDIELWDWIAAASPLPDVPPIDQVEGWAQAWLFCSRWAGTVRRRPAYTYHAERAGIGPLLEAVQVRIVEIAQSRRWPEMEEIVGLELDALESTFAQFEVARHVEQALFADATRYSNESEADARRPRGRVWALELRLELSARGQLPRSCTEVSEYDGAGRVSITPTQLGSDEFGRPIPRSRMTRILDEWCDFFESGPTPIRSLEIASRVPKRLVSALRGQTQLRSLELKWGDYDDLSAVAGMPGLWKLRLGGASGLADLGPLRDARSLRVLELENSRRVTYYSCLAELGRLEEFHLTSASGSGPVTVPTISFVSGMAGLRYLGIGVRVADEDYAPLLDRADVDVLWVQQQRRMHPSYDELVARIPGLR